MLADQDDLVALHVGHEKDTLARFVQDREFLEARGIRPLSQYGLAM